MTFECECRNCVSPDSVRKENEQLVGELAEQVKNLTETRDLLAERLEERDAQVRSLQNELVMFDASVGQWVGKKPLTIKQMNICIRFINENLPNVSKQRQNTMKAIVRELQDTIDEVPKLPIDPAAADRVWVGNDGIPLKIAEVPLHRLLNILRFAYRNFVDRERPGQWENITAAVNALGENWEKKLQKWDRDEREKVEQLMRPQLHVNPRVNIDFIDESIARCVMPGCTQRIGGGSIAYCAEHFRAIGEDRAEETGL